MFICDHCNNQIITELLSFLGMLGSGENVNPHSPPPQHRGCHNVTCNRQMSLIHPVKQLQSFSHTQDYARGICRFRFFMHTTHITCRFVRITDRYLEDNRKRWDNGILVSAIISQHNSAIFQQALSF